MEVRGSKRSVLRKNERAKRTKQTLKTCVKRRILEKIGIRKVCEKGEEHRED